ncbi:MAG: amidase [Tahibacter sp.]
MESSSIAGVSERALRSAGVCQQLHWLAAGRIDAARLSDCHLAAIERENPRLNAYVALDRERTAAQAALAAARRADGASIGRLDGIPIALKDNLDLAGWATTAGLSRRRERRASQDAACVERLRGAGAVIVGKTNLDEAGLGALGNNPHFGAVQNPWRNGYSAGGSSSGAAAAVAAGLCSAAIGSDSLGSLRIPASHCGVFALKPTHGQISTRGMVPAARRLDTIGILARGVNDLVVLLQVLAGHDPADPRSRQRRVDLALPDWEPGRLRCGTLPNLAALGVAPAVIEVFESILSNLRQELGQRSIVNLYDYSFEKARRAGLLLIEAEMLGTFAEDLADTSQPVSANLRGLLDFARGKSAADYVNADRMLDASVLKARRMFAEVDVLLLPTVPQGPQLLADGEPPNSALLTAFASLAGCPALSIPMGRLPDGMPIGLQMVGPPGSDLRLLELAEVCAAALDATPSYPVGS